MKKQLTTLVLAVTATWAGSMVSQSQAVITDFTAADSLATGDWKSGDTRDATGTVLNGLLSSHAAGGTAADDLAIADRISFVSGATAPAGSNGAVRLNATTANQGKAHLSVQGNTSASFLLSDEFEASYRYYNEPDPTSRTLGVSFGVEFAGVTYSFSHINPANASNVWQTDSLSADTGEWRLFSDAWSGSYKGYPAGPEEAYTFEDWATKIITTDGINSFNIGDVLNNGTLYEVGFNLGSYQRNNNQYVDWFGSNVINLDDTGHLTLSAPAIPTPEPATAGLLGLGLLAVAARRRRRA